MRRKGGHPEGALISWKGISHRSMGWDRNPEGWVQSGKDHNLTGAALMCQSLTLHFKLGSHSRALKMYFRGLLDRFTALSNVATLNESFSAFYFNLAFFLMGLLRMCGWTWLGTRAMTPKLDKMLPSTTPAYLPTSAFPSFPAWGFLYCANIYCGQWLRCTGLEEYNTKLYVIWFVLVLRAFSITLLNI